MIKFEKVSRFKDDEDIALPARQTANSAGYDFVIAEDVVIPPIDFYTDKIREKGYEDGRHEDYYGFLNPFTLDEMASVTKELKAKPTLVSTGMKCYLEPNTYLELSVRSSTPLKHWLIMANGVGIIDADYADNQDNEGEIFFQLINLSPFAIKLQKGERIGQGIIHEYKTVDNEPLISTTRDGGFGSTSR